MALPNFLTFVRHGQSEANVIQKRVKSAGEQPADVPAGFIERHDSFMRLSALGVEQAQATGDFLASEPGFDRFYVSPHIRARETAHHLQLNGAWRIDDRVRERDYGEVMSHIPLDEETRRIRSLHDWYWKPPGGESMSTGVRLRVESLMNSLYRREGVNNVVVVAHGELIRTAQFVIERLTPDMVLDLDGDPAYRVENTMVVQYTRRNPEDVGDVASHYKWRRAICPWDRSLDWDGGRWVHADTRKFSDQDLLASVEKYKRVL